MWEIPLFKIYWDERDVDYVVSAIEKGMYWAEGPNIEKFERLIAEYIGANYCVAFNSGTSALHAALLAHRVRKGDEVIVPSFTFVATANAPLFVGAKPVFAEIEEETLGLDPEDVKEKITNKTKAIIPVHYAGCPCKIKELKEIAEDYNLILIEDAAEAFGAKIKDKKVGTFGDSAMFSFCQNKIITTGEGGAVVTNSKDIFEKLKLIRSHGRSETGYFTSVKAGEYISLGYNFRMSDITAALGVAQMEKIDKIISMRVNNATELTEMLKREVKRVRPPEPPNGYFHVYQMYTIRVKGKHRDNLIKFLSKKKIMTKIYFPPVHLTHFYKNILKYDIKLKVTEEISGEVLSLPMYPTLSWSEKQYIVSSIKEYFEVFS